MTFLFNHPSPITNDQSWSWTVLVKEGRTAAEQMAIDVQLAEAGRPAFRLFRWARPAVSLGLKQPAPAWVDADRLARHNIELVERPTGGALAVHGSDLSCSIVIPVDCRLTLQELMQRVCGTVVRAVAVFDVAARHVVEGPGTRVEYCLTEESPYAIMVGARKLCGFAVRRYADQWLIQGSLLMRALPEAFSRVMPQAVMEGFQTRAISLEQAAGGPTTDQELVIRMIEAWAQTWRFGAPVRPCTSAPEHRQIEPQANGLTGERADGYAV